MLEKIYCKNLISNARISFYFTGSFSVYNTVDTKQGTYCDLSVQQDGSQILLYRDQRHIERPARWLQEMSPNGKKESLVWLYLLNKRILMVILRNLHCYSTLANIWNCKEVSSSQAQGRLKALIFRDQMREWKAWRPG